MKKIFTLIAAVVLCSTAAMADDITIGKTDFSDNYLGATSDRYRITKGEKVTFTFTNYSDQKGNSHNWVACAESTTPDVEGKYAMLMALRADNWENVQWANTGVASNYNWDTFIADMHESSVVLTYSYQDVWLTAHASITTKAGIQYFEEFSKFLTDEAANVFVGIENSYIVLSNVTTENISNTVIGNEDNHTQYYRARTEQLILQEGQVATFEFTNYTCKGGNWNNWVACVSNDVTLDTEGWINYIALRADNWDNVQGGNNGITSNFNWDTFLNDIDGANVVLTFTYAEGKVAVAANITTTEGKSYKEEYAKEVTGTIRTWVTVDNSHIVLSKAEVTSAPTAIQAVKAAANTAAVRYNLAGQKVGAGFKGIAIENGKKILVK